MFAGYEIDFDNRIVVVKFTGTLTVSDIQGYVAKLRADPRFSPSFSEIVDLTRVKEVKLNARDAMILSDRVDPFLPSSKRAFIATDRAEMHAAHIHRILVDSGNIRVCSSRGEADEWIFATMMPQAVE